MSKPQNVWITTMYISKIDHDGLCYLYKESGHYTLTRKHNMVKPGELMLHCGVTRRDGHRFLLDGEFVFVDQPYDRDIRIVPFDPDNIDHVKFIEINGKAKHAKR
jgi:hypothetical protein